MRPINKAAVQSAPDDHAPTPARVLSRHASRAEWAVTSLMTSKPVSSRAFWSGRTLARLTGTLSVAQPDDAGSKGIATVPGVGQKVFLAVGQTRARPSHDGSLHSPVSSPNAGQGCTASFVPPRPSCSMRSGTRLSTKRHTLGIWKRLSASLSDFQEPLAVARPVSSRRGMSSTKLQGPKR